LGGHLQTKSIKVKGYEDEVSLFIFRYINILSVFLNIPLGIPVVSTAAMLVMYLKTL
jgi:hypothetical protein